jgi:hypothetical protein
MPAPPSLVECRLLPNSTVPHARPGRDAERCPLSIAARSASRPGSPRPLPGPCQRRLTAALRHNVARCARRHASDALPKKARMKNMRSRTALAERARTRIQADRIPRPGWALRRQGWSCAVTTASGIHLKTSIPRVAGLDSDGPLGPSATHARSGPARDAHCQRQCARGHSLPGGGNGCSRFRRRMVGARLARAAPAQPWVTARAREGPDRPPRRPARAPVPSPRLQRDCRDESARPPAASPVS